MLTPVMDSCGLCIYNLRGDIGEHDGRNEGFLTEWIFSLREDLCAASMFNRSTEELDWKQTYIAIELFQTVEEELAGKPGKRSLNALCGKYDHPEDADFYIDEVFVEDGKLYARFIDEERGAFTGQLYPNGKKTFGRKGGFTKLIFGRDCVTYNNLTCKKL